MRRCRLYVHTEGQRSASSPVDQEPALRLQWFNRWYADFGCGDRGQEAQDFDSAAEVLAAVRDFAAARGIAVSLEEDEGCVVFARP